ncbi:MAG: HlyD family secretion protein [Gammaproteobacteria bacterium]|nr:MAG: HlyD family secretion protein [Gammaproteobacteria bacterium]
MATKLKDTALQRPKPETETTPAAKAEEQQAEIPGDEAGKSEDVKKPDPVRRLTRIVLAVVVVLFIWYVFADRLAPWTDQARVQGFVVPIAPEVSGDVTKVIQGIDQIVQAGQLLLQIDLRPYEIAVKRAQAALEEAGQQVGAGTAAVKSAGARLLDARAQVKRAEQGNARVQRIYRQDPGATSQSDLEQAETTLLQAKALEATAEAELEKAKQQLGKKGRDNPRLRSAIAALEQAQLDLADASIRAPLDGAVTNVKIDVGQYARAGTPIMTFVSNTDVWIQANMRENSLGRVKAGDAVDIALDVAPGRIFKGKVASIGFGVSQGLSGAPGELTTAKGDSGWLRDAQRFPVIIKFADDSAFGLRRVGGQADIQIYTGNHPILNTLGWFWIRLMSLLSYVY